MGVVEAEEAEEVEVAGVEQDSSGTLAEEVVESALCFRNSPESSLRMV